MERAKRSKTGEKRIKIQLYVKQKLFDAVQEIAVKNKKTQSRIFGAFLTRGFNDYRDGQEAPASKRKASARESKEDPEPRETVHVKLQKALTIKPPKIESKRIVDSEYAEATAKYKDLQRGASMHGMTVDDVQE